MTIAVPATDAGASPLAPTDWRSEIVSVTPTSPGVHLEVLGGDSVLRLTARPGTDVTVLGYENEPYLHIAADGTVEANIASPAYSLNRSRTGQGSLDPDADAKLDPRWTVIGTDGTVLWHDHRIHAMPGVTDDIEWTIPMIVDGGSVTAQGRLLRLPGHSPSFEILIGLLAFGVVVFLGRRSPLRIAAIAAAAAGAISTAIAAGAFLSTPDGLWRPWAPLLISSLAFAGSILVLAAFDRLSTRLRLALVLASIALSAGWVALGLPALTAAIVPGAFAGPVVRFSITTVIGLLLGGAGLTVMSGGLIDGGTMISPHQAEEASGG